MSSWNERKITHDNLLPYVDSTTAPPDVKAALHTLPFERNVFKLLANSPNYFPQFMAFLARNFVPTKALRPSEWQITVLLTSVHLDCPYEWDVNYPVASLLPSMQAPKFEAIRKLNVRESALFNQREKAISRLVGEIAKGEKATLDTMKEMKELFTDEEIMEIFMIHGTYAMIARMMNSCQIGFDEPIEGLEGMLREGLKGDLEREERWMAAEKAAK